MDGTSRMNREVHVRFCESRGLKCSRLLGNLCQSQLSWPPRVQQLLAVDSEALLGEVTLNAPVTERRKNN